MGERLQVECNACRDRDRCSERNLRSWQTALYWARGAEILPCLDYRTDVRIETGFTGGRFPRPPLTSSARMEIVR